jgi:hypothetical protein
MSSLLFYQEQAAQQQAAAEAATLQNVRERCQRAADSWAALAERTERIENGRARKHPGEPGEGTDDRDAGLMTFKDGV